MNRKDEVLNYKTKSDFIFVNSGLICSKLDNDKTYEETLNYLQVLLLCDLSLEQLSEIYFYLSNKNNMNGTYDNTYSNCIKIIFTVCEFVNNSNYSEEGKASLRNKLREYTKFFRYNKDDLRNNSNYVKLKI